MTSERRYDIDWLRVIAIGLLLFYHIAIIFQPWAMFIGFMKNDETLEGLWKLMSMLNVWRIPFLFYVSGMGLYFAMKKRNFQQLIAERSKRILLPFIFGIVAISPLHFLIFQKYYHLPLSYYPHAGHLWFLGNIFAYVLLLSPLFLFLIRKEDGKFVVDLSLRNNRTSKEHPLGIFHPHEEVHHIKKENIGLIEVMGLAVLPGRLLKELEKIKEYLRDEISLDNIEEYHRPWALELKKKFDYLKSSTDLNDFVNKELSNKFVSVLEHCGVFKLNEEGLEGFKRFTNSLNS